MVEDPGLARLREHLQRHNRRVLILTFVTLLIASVLWAVLYFITWWLFLLGGTAVHSVDFEPVAGPLMRGFLTTAAVLCILAWFLRRMRPNHAARDRKSAGEHFLDLLLVVPRVTLGVFGLGRAALRLTDPELEGAWTLLQHMSENGKPLPAQELPVDIPDATMRERIVLALQLSGLIEIRPTSSGPVFAFRNDEARHLAQTRVRLR